MPDHARQGKVVHLVAAATAITIWGFSFVCVKVVLAEISAFTLIAVRYFFGSLVLGLFAWRRREWQSLGWQDYRWIALLGLVGITFQQMLQVSGQAYSTASVAAILACTAPAFTVLLAAVVLGERINRRQVAGIVFACCGASVVSLGDFQETDFTLGLTSTGNLLVLASAIVWAAFMVLTRIVATHRPTTVVTAGMFGFGFCFSLPFALLEGRLLDVFSLSVQGSASLLYMIVAATVAAYSLNTFALRHLSTSRVAIIQTIEPISAVAASALLLGERMTVLLLAGGCATVIGIWLAEHRSTSLAEDKGPSVDMP